MTVTTALALVAAGIGGGLASVIAGVATVVSYPVLLALGLPPLTANVTNTVALVLIGPGSVLGSRRELTGQRARVIRLCLVTACGGGAGAAILLLAPADAFAYAVPVLIGGASAVLLIQPRLRGLDPVPGAERSAARHAAVFAVSVYAGYFGAAGGVLLLAVLSTMLAQPLVRTNAVKNAIACAANGVAAIGFALLAPVRWSFVPLLAAGFGIGGYLGSRLVRRLPDRTPRLAAAAVGLAVAARLGWSAYR